MNDKKIVLVIDRYEGDIRSTPKYLQMLRDNLPEGYELVLMSDKEIRGQQLDQVWIDELNALVDGQMLLTKVLAPYKEHRKSKPYWQKGRFG